MDADITRLRPTEAARLLNSAAEADDRRVLSVRTIRKHLDEDGLQIGDGDRIHLVRYAAWARKRQPPTAAPFASSTASSTTASDRYATIKEEARARRAAASAAGRDIGPIPDIVNPQRRERCRRSLRLFCEIYNPATFCWAWSADQLDVLTAIEQGIFRGGLLAFALPRGSGKTAICRMAVLWSISYAHVPYAFLIGATEPKALENLEAVKTWIRDLPDYGDDFPEISMPVRALGGIVTRAPGQLCCGHNTMLRWERDRIVLPRVPPPSNLDCPGPLAPSAAVVLGVSGLTGEGIRGSLFTAPDGGSVRPKLVLLDDPQTDESARSPTGNEMRESLIRGAVLGMAGPGQRITAIMPCTVIRSGDMADRLLDRQRNPLWRGVRRPMLTSIPKDLEAWERYFEVYRECMGRTVPDIEPANRHYLKHRAELDAGAVASWPARKSSDEVSAIQHAMNLYCERGKAAFFAEYQNAPLSGEASAKNLKADELVKRVSGQPREAVSLACQAITAFVDVHDDALFYQCTAWEPHFAAGQVVDYGTWPAQPDRYFTLDALRATLAGHYPGVGKDAAIFAGLRDLLLNLAGRRFPRDDGAEMSLGLVLVDTGYVQKIVAKVLRTLDLGELVRPSKGFGIRAAQKAMDEYRNEAGVQAGHHFRIAPAPGTALRTVNIDTNHWKSFVRDRLLTPIGDHGALTLFGNYAADPELHRLWADHQTSESFAETFGRGRKVDEWKLKPGSPDNHWWDCCVGCAAAAAVLGLSMPAWSDERPKRRRVSLSNMTARR